MNENPQKNSCPDDNAIAAYIESANITGAEQDSEITSHLLACEDCRLLVANAGSLLEEEEQTGKSAWEKYAWVAVLLLVVVPAWQQMNQPDTLEQGFKLESMQGQSEGKALFSFVAEEELKLTLGKKTSYSLGDSDFTLVLEKIVAIAPHVKKLPVEKIFFTGTERCCSVFYDKKNKQLILTDSQP